MKPILTFLALLVSSLLFGQSNFNGFSLTAKAGLAYWKNIAGYWSQSYEGSFIRNKTMYSFGYLNTEESVWGSNDNTEKLYQYSLMIGKYEETRNFRFECEIGPSVSNRQYRFQVDDDSKYSGYSYKRKNEYNPGINLEASIGFLIYSRACLGINYQANLNTKYISRGPMLFFKIGILNDRDKVERNKQK
ncbi:MAG: hypothetical protein RIC35_18095 [Marinoscillum sp.]